MHRALLNPIIVPIAISEDHVRETGELVLAMRRNTLTIIILAAFAIVRELTIIED